MYQRHLYRKMLSLSIHPIPHQSSKKKILVQIEMIPGW